VACPRCEMVTRPDDRVTRLGEVYTIDRTEDSLRRGEGRRELFLDEGGELVFRPLCEGERLLVVLSFHRLFGVAKDLAEMRGIDPNFRRQFEPSPGGKDLLSRGIEDRELVCLRPGHGGELEGPLVVKPLERLLRVDEHLDDLRHIDVSLLRLRDERRGARNRVEGLSVQRRRLARPVVPLVQEAKALVIVLYPEREPSPPDEVRHLIHVDPESLSRGDAAPHESAEFLDTSRARPCRLLPGRDDFPCTASREEPVQLAVADFDRSDFRPEVYPHPTGAPRSPHDFFPFAPDPPSDN